MPNLQSFCGTIQICQKAKSCRCCKLLNLKGKSTLFCIIYKVHQVYKFGNLHLGMFDLNSFVRRKWRPFYRDTSPHHLLGQHPEVFYLSDKASNYQISSRSIFRTLLGTMSHQKQQNKCWLTCRLPLWVRCPLGPGKNRSPRGSGFGSHSPK